MNAEFSPQNEERIVQFVEHELTPSEERAVLDECASSDEMRTLLKQHVSLSRNIGRTLSGIAVPAAAEAAVAGRLAPMRQSAVSSWRRASVVTAIAGVTMVAAIAGSYVALRTTPAPPAALPVVVVQQPAPTPAAVESSATPVASKPAPAVRHHGRRAEATPPIASRPTATVPADVKSKPAHRTPLKLGKPDEVH